MGPKIYQESTPTSPIPSTPKPITALVMSRICSSWGIKGIDDIIDVYKEVLESTGIDLEGNEKPINIKELCSKGEKVKSKKKSSIDLK